MSDELHLAVEMERLRREAKDPEMDQVACQAVESRHHSWLLVRPHLLCVFDHARQFRRPLLISEARVSSSSV
jgi:hypothetical protein